MRHSVGKISTRATTLVQTLSRLDSAVGSYELSKCRDSNQDSFGIISGLQLGSPRKNNHLDVAPAERCREYYMGEGDGFPRIQAMVSFVCQSARGLSGAPSKSQLSATLHSWTLKWVQPGTWECVIQCAIRELELRIIILFIHKLWSFERVFFGINLVVIMAFNFNVWSIDKLNMEIISYLESEYEFFCAWKRFVGDHFKKAIGTID